MVFGKVVIKCIFMLKVRTDVSEAQRRHLKMGYIYKIKMIFYQNEKNGNKTRQSMKRYNLIEEKVKKWPANVLRSR